MTKYIFEDKVGKTGIVVELSRTFIIAISYGWPVVPPFHAIKPSLNDERF